MQNYKDSFANLSHIKNVMSNELININNKEKT